MPFFSVIIPAYNRESLIQETINSVLKQDFDDQEVIVVDDGSTDGTRDVLAGYGNRIRVLCQQNRGPGAARNLGLAHATGRYVSIFDSDDLRFPWTLSTYARAIEEHNYPAFVTGWPVIFRDCRELDDVQQVAGRIEPFEDYFASSDAWRWFSASSFVIRRDVLQAVGGFTNERISADDCDLAMRLGTAKGFVHIAAPNTFGYREHPTSLKSDGALAQRSLAYLIAQEQTGCYPGGLRRRKERIEILSRHVRPFVLDAFRAGRSAAAWNMYRATWQWNFRLGRLKYLLGAPCIAGLHALQTRRSRSMIAQAQDTACPIP